MSSISNIFAREILDSRGTPTVEAEITLASGVRARASVPSGVSTGSREAHELRDGDMRRFNGMGVKKAVSNINEKIAPELYGIEAEDQPALDKLLTALDGTPNKEHLGANAILAVSLAAARAAAAEAGQPLFRYLGGINARRLPVPMLNFINGGLHADSTLAFQEFMIRPAGAANFSDALEISGEVYCQLRTNLKKWGMATTVGDEGGFAPVFPGGIIETLDKLAATISDAGFTVGREIHLAIDCAASTFYRDGCYDYSCFGNPDEVKRSTSEQVEFLAYLVSAYNIDSIEDGMAEDDTIGWKLLTDKLGNRCQLIGDDLFATNSELLKCGAENGWGNAVLIKPNQIGTLSETMETIECAGRCGYLPIISHRSGETADTFIADLAVACNAGQIKAGGLSRVDRVTKYNQLLRIEELLGDQALFGL